jgi:hypothetical protein
MSGINIAGGKEQAGSQQEIANKVKDRFSLPDGYKRIPTEGASFQFYLQSFPLKEHGTKVYYYTGKQKVNQRIHAAVLDIDVGTHDLQQCADAVMRIRAEYLYAHNRFDEICFNFVSDGKPRCFLDYKTGITDYNTFRKYMNYVFSYANTRSLKHQLNKVEEYSEMKIGDVFIQSGNPYGHAVIVMDMAENVEGKRIFLLAQSYMPAQDIHILKNPRNKILSPWYELNTCQDEIITPEWDFVQTDLRRF